MADYRAWLQTTNAVRDTRQGRVKAIAVYQKVPIARDALDQENNQTNMHVVKTGIGDILSPLQVGNGYKLVFPYTPSVTMAATAEYEDMAFTQTNYQYPSYNRTYTSDITVVADFTSQTTSEARHTLAVMRFLSGFTKSEFGKKAGEHAGTPPTVLRFNYLGEHQFKNVPVVINSYNYTFDTDVDYVPVQVAGTPAATYVPTFISITLTLKLYYNPKLLRDDFDLFAFKNGLLLNKGYI